MRSQHADRFNHDEDAPEYDLDVRHEQDPIRAGYAELLEWVAAAAQVGPDARVLELGSGTGNLTVLLPPVHELICVDISSAMTAIARDKLVERPGIQWVEADLLECLEPPHASAQGAFDAVVSSYAIHHLVPEERALLFARLVERLRPRGRIVVGDLMFADEEARERFVASARARRELELADTIEDEFFWLLDRDRARLEELGLAVATRRFSELSWGIVAARE
jgi:putative AdoMet-dependent methyltransferase